MGVQTIEVQPKECSINFLWLQVGSSSTLLGAYVVGIQ